MFLIVFSTRWDVVKPSKSLRLYTIVSGWLAWLAGWLGCLAWLAGWLAGWAVWPGWLAGWAGLAGWLAWLGPCWAGKGGLGTVSGCPGPVLLSGIYPGSIRDSRAGLGWAVLRLAGLAWPGWLAGLAGWLLVGLAGLPLGLAGLGCLAWLAWLALAWAGWAMKHKQVSLIHQ